MKKAFYSTETRRLVAYGFIETFPDAVGVEVDDEFQMPLYSTIWSGTGFEASEVPAEFSVHSPRASN